MECAVVGGHGYADSTADLPVRSSASPGEKTAPDVGTITGLTVWPKNKVALATFIGSIALARGRPRVTGKFLFVASGTRDFQPRLFLEAASYNKQDK